MREIDKRLSELEQKLTPQERLSAWIAYVALDGTVKMTHAKHDTIYLQHRNDILQFETDNNLKEWQVIIVDSTRPAGEPLKEL